MLGETPEGAFIAWILGWIGVVIFLIATYIITGKYIKKGK